MEIKQKNIHRLFDLSIIIKGVDGLLEVVGGFVFLFISPQSLNGIVAFLIAHELSEDPKDWFASYLSQTAHHLSLNTKLFAAIYLIFHGIIKIFLVAGLLRKKFWAYPTAIVFLSLFIFYQTYRFINTHSIELLLLTLFDIFIVWLVWQEYKYQCSLNAQL
ncbi:MAG: DUF2127 domain-containing protein [Acidobacteriota bacterium]|nr:DUF2127 domain-containing protein [Acidobacteriota bacterium]